MAAVEHGDRIDFKKRQKIRAEVLRHIVLGLPLFRKGIRPLAGIVPCAKTGAGVRIGGATITGRLCLDAAIGEERGPICPLDFTDCQFEPGQNERGAAFTIGFSGANAHFACLGFRDCRFNDREGTVVNGADTKFPPPTIELSGAKIDSSLDMQGIRPLGDDDGRVPPEARWQLPYLWIRAIGTRIDGNLDLSRAHLGAPDDDRTKRVWASSPILPLNLTLAKIQGDFLFLSGGQSRGTISTRSARIEGDVWMSGATIRCRECDARALFLQMATIGGGLMLDGRREMVDDESGDFFRFDADGELNLFGVRVGGALVMNDVHISAADICLNLTGARVDGQVEIGTKHHPEPSTLQGRIRLDRMEVKTSVMIRNVRLGHSEPAAPRRHSLDARALVTRQFVIEDVQPIGDTGDHPRGRQAPAPFLSVTLRDARFESLAIRDSRLTGPLDASPVHCTGDVRLDAFVKGGVDLAAATIGGCLDISGLGMEAEDAWHSLKLRNARLTRLKVEQCRLAGPLEAGGLQCGGDLTLAARATEKVDLEGSTIGGSLDISGLRIEGTDACLSLKDATIGRTLRLTPGSDSKPGFRLSGTADLSGLSCDTLDDEIGTRWGKSVRFRMNHFRYRRTALLSEPEPDGREGQGQPDCNSPGGRRREPGDAGQGPRRWPLPRLLKPPSPRQGQSRKPSHRIVGDWLRNRRAEGRKPWRWLPGWLPPERNDCWDLWQLRRNWIYRQFGPDDPQADSEPHLSILRHEVREEDYRPQPFEQAIRVARAEGREDFATNFEIHKQWLEWRLFNLQVRWGLAGVAITLAAGWLVVHDPSVPSIAATLLALLVTAGLMTFGSSLCFNLQVLIQSPRFAGRATRALCLLPWLLLFAIWFMTHGPSVPSTAAILAAFLVTVGLVAFASRLRTHLERLSLARLPSHDRTARRYARRATWVLYWLPAFLLFPLWFMTPFHFLVALAIFLAIRGLGVFTHGILRFGFGYLRRPLSAVMTLTGAFVLGWWAVSVAADRDMFVVAAEPVAQAAANWKVEHHESLLMGSLRSPEDRFVRDLSCAHEISEPLYALDLLIPIVDLGEERRCEVRRIPASRVEHLPPGEVSGEEMTPVAEMTFVELAAAFPGLTLDNHRFWWWMKALYAIAGWVIVSLAILTFAQVNKTHAEPPMGEE